MLTVLSLKMEQKKGTEIMFLKIRRDHAKFSLLKTAIDARDKSIDLDIVLP